MSNIVKFPRSETSRSSVPASAATRASGMRLGAMALRVLSCLFYGLRVTTFVVLSWLRMPVKAVCNLISVPAMLAWLFALYAFPDKTAMVWGFGIISLVAFAFSLLYDFVLMAIAPADMMMTL